MEQYRSQLRLKGTTPSNDPDTRMPQRPRAKDQAYADLGNDFSSSSRQDTTPYVKKANTSKRPNSRRDCDTSFDELDLLSQPSPDVGVVNRSRLPKSNSRDGKANEDGFVVDGERHTPLEGYEVDGKEKLKGLSFKKNKDTALKASQRDPFSSAPKPAPKVTRNTTRPPISNALHKPFRPPTQINQGEGSSKPTSLPRRPPSPPPSPSHQSWLHDSDPEGTPRPPKSRQTGRVASLGTRRAIERKSPSLVKEEKGKARAKPAEFPIPLTETSNSKVKPSVLSKPVKAPFPMDVSSSAQRENSNDAASKKKRLSSPPLAKTSSQTSQGSKRAPSSEVDRGPDERRRKQVAKPPSEDTPATSSQGSRSGDSNKPARRRPAEFPSLSPIRKGTKSKAKLEAKISKGTIYSSEDTEDDTARPKAQPFPMATQMLESLGHSPAKRGSSSPTSGSDSDDDGRRERKRARGADEIMRELMFSDGLDGEEDEAALFMDPDLDPTRLCPWCDELLPPAPSPHLQRLIDTARTRSVKDPRPTNPLGLHADAAVLVNVCHRHRFEHKQIPLARQRGWPTQIEWAKLGSRVRRHELHLQLLVDDVDEEFLPGNERQKDEEDDNVGGEDSGGGDDESLLPTRPRKGSAFWLEVVRSVKKKGAQKAAGVRGQMSTFNRTQPGYYGELGSVIISQTIYDLFPPASFPADSTLPLTPTEFIQGILVPEAALKLVMEDMHQTRQEALRTLRDSAQYGVAMFPDDAREGKSASEAIVKARAAVRRAELHREEQLEAEQENALWDATDDFSDSALAQAVDAHTAAPESSQSRPRRECAQRAAPIVDSSDSDVSMTSVRSRRAKSKKPASRRAAKAPAGSDAIELSDTPSLSKPVSRASRAKARAASAASDAKSDTIELSDAPSLTKPRPRPRPKQKTTAYGTDARTGMSSDHDAPSSSNPALAPPEVTFGARGEMHKRVQREDGSFETIDLERTPKAKKRAASSTFPLKIARASRLPQVDSSSLTYPLNLTPPHELIYPPDDL